MKSAVTWDSIRAAYDNSRSRPLSTRQSRLSSIARTLTFGRVRRRRLTQLDLRQRPLVFAEVLAQLAYNEQTRSGFESF
jgi:hypothetical protein